MTVTTAAAKLTPTRSFARHTEWGRDAGGRGGGRGKPTVDAVETAEQKQFIRGWLSGLAPELKRFDIQQPFVGEIIMDTC